MPLTNSWLVTYAIAQLGKPYVWGAYGQFQVSERQSYTEGLNKGANPYYNQSVKVHDCSGLVYAALCCDTISGVPDTSKAPIAHLAQTQFSSHCSQKGPIASIDVTTLPPGTLVFKGEIDNIYHVGVYVGPITWKGTTYQNGVVEAMGKAYGVTISNVSNWKWWGQLDCCEVNTSSTNMSMIQVPTYGTSSDTPSIYNQNSGTATVSGETVSNVEWTQTGTDPWGNPIGYSYTSGANFTPFIATVSPNAKKVDYAALKSAKVSAMMFCAGWWYDNYNAGHIHRKEYINPHLEDQISECTSAGLPYALYAIVRAKNEIEADEECKRLYYVISKFPPGLGLWLLLDMHNQRAPINVNEKVLDRYYRYIYDWGLSAKCGLYMDKSRMYQIDWNKYQNKFYLWLQDHVDQHTLDTINDKVLKSEFFEVD